MQHSVFRFLWELVIFIPAIMILIVSYGPIFEHGNLPVLFLGDMVAKLPMNKQIIGHLESSNLSVELYNHIFMAWLSFVIMLLFALVVFVISIVCCDAKMIAATSPRTYRREIAESFVIGAFLLGVMWLWTAGSDLFCVQRCGVFHVTPSNLPSMLGYIPIKIAAGYWAVAFALFMLSQIILITKGKNNE